MNKISKKIVSLVTVAAFATTLVPAAAFGATFGGTEATNIDLVGGDQKLVLAENGSVSATVKVDLGALKLENDNKDQIAIWVGTDAVDPTAQADQPTYSQPANVTYYAPAATGTWTANMAWYYNTTETKFDVNVTFNDDGVYPLYAGVCDLDLGDDSYEDIDAQLLGTITVVNASSVVDADDSQLLVGNNAHSASATQNVAKPFEFNVLDNEGVETDYALNANGGQVYVWAEYADGTIVKDAQFTQAEKADKTKYDIAATDADKDGIWEVTSGEVNNGDKLNVIIPKAGDGFVVRAVVAAQAPTVVENNKVELKANTATLNPITLNVAKAEVAVAGMEFTSVTGADKPTATNQEKTVWYTEIKDDVTPSDTKDYTVKGKVTNDKGAAIEGEELYVSCDDSNLKLQGDGTVTTDAKGEFSFKFNLLSDGKYTIKVTEADGDYVGTLIVKQGDVDAVDIAVVKDGGVVLAGTDKDYAKEVYGDGYEALSDAVQFAITDAYGRDAMGPGPITDEAAAHADWANHADSLEIKGDTPDSVDANDFELAWDENAGVYTLAYVGDAKDLVAGDYSIRVALNNGGKQAVTVNFTVAEFGDVEELVLDMSAAEKKWWAGTSQDNAITAIDDQVALGQWVKVVPKYVDANGLKVTANAAKMQVGINGDAVVDREINGQNIGFATAANSAANNALVGSTITVKVNDASLGAIGYVEKELTVVKNYLAETVTMDPVQGVVGESNTATVSVVDENGNVSKVNGTLTATVVAQSDETANVDLKVNPQVKNGTARIYLESDKAGTADVRLVVEAANGELYADTITYTFGDEDPYAGSYVVMTIGASDYLINGSVVEGDGAPYVDDAWRTMVPFRVLGEAFGAEVEWNQDAQSVTYTVGDTELVMTIGEDTYTLNGEEQTMDTAPVLSGDRTYVPVRFVAEDLGFEVTPLYDATTGATASVVFQK